MAGTLADKSAQDRNGTVSIVHQADFSLGAERDDACRGTPAMGMHVTFSAVILLLVAACLPAIGEETPPAAEAGGSPAVLLDAHRKARTGDLDSLAGLYASSALVATAQVISTGTAAARDGDGPLEVTTLTVRLLNVMKKPAGREVDTRLDCWQYPITGSSPQDSLLVRELSFEPEPGSACVLFLEDAVASESGLQNGHPGWTVTYRVPYDTLRQVVHTGDARWTLELFHRELVTKYHFDIHGYDLLPLSQTQDTVWIGTRAVTFADCGGIYTLPAFQYRGDPSHYNIRNFQTSDRKTAWKDKVTYPPEALQQGITGAVALAVIICADGSVRLREPKGEKPKGFGFQEEIIRILPALFQNPSTYHGIGIPALSYLRFLFVPEEFDPETGRLIPGVSPEAACP